LFELHANCFSLPKASPYPPWTLVPEGGSVFTSFAPRPTIFVTSRKWSNALMDSRLRKSRTWVGLLGIASPPPAPDHFRDLTKMVQRIDGQLFAKIPS